MWADPLFLASRYLRSSPGRTAVLVLGVSVALFLPLFTYRASSLIEGSLLARADATPIIIGAKGNELDLVMASLYFRGQPADPIRYGERRDSEARGYGAVVPLFVRYTADSVPVVGTSPEYFGARGLRTAEGRLPALLGEVVAGARVAGDARLRPGDTVRSDLTNLYNLAGAYPTLLAVVGVLEPTGGPDDEVYFADLKTTWVLEGLVHGHEAVTAEQSPRAFQAGDAAGDAETENLEATAAIFLFDKITDSNRASFHLHGSEADAPLTSLLVFPADDRRRDQLLGDYALETTRQAIQPVAVVREVLGIVLRVERALAGYFAAVALSTLSFFVLAVWLSLRLRRSELELVRRIGGSPGAVAAMVGAEVAIVVVAAAVVALLLTWASVGLLARTLL